MSKYSKVQLKEWAQKAIANRNRGDVVAAMQFVAVMSGISLDQAWRNTEELANG